VTLAPFYDLLSTVAYPDLSPKLAMKIAKRTPLEQVGPATWSAFAEDTGLAAPFVRRRVKELAAAVVAQVPSIPGGPGLAGLDEAALTEHSALIVSRAERVARTSTT
jgi:serine/threonine-protein kinase HipA